MRRHASACRVSLTLSYLDDVVVLEVQDDGRGSDPEQLATGDERLPRVGLTAMPERGGTARRDTPPWRTSPAREPQSQPPWPCRVRPRTQRHRHNARHVGAAVGDVGLGATVPSLVDRGSALGPCLAGADDVADGIRGTGGRVQRLGARGQPPQLRSHPIQLLDSLIELVGSLPDERGHMRARRLVTVPQRDDLADLTERGVFGDTPARSASRPMRIPPGYVLTFPHAGRLMLGTCNT